MWRKILPLGYILISYLYSQNDVIELIKRELIHKFLRPALTNFTDDGMKIPSKEALRNKKWKPHKYQAGNNILEPKYHTSATKTPITPNIYTFTTEYMLRTFTYLEPVDGKNSLTGAATTERVTNINFGEITRNVSEYVTDEADYFAKEDADITILSSITTTEKYRHVDDFRIPNKTRKENETKSDYDNYSDYYDVQYDSTLQQLVSFIYINNEKNEKDVKTPDLLTSIKPKKVTTMIGESKTGANKKAPTLSLKKQSTNLLNRPMPDKLNKAKSPTKGQRPKAKSVNTKYSKTVSKTHNRKSKKRRGTSFNNFRFSSF